MRLSKFDIPLGDTDERDDAWESMPDVPEVGGSDTGADRPETELVDGSLSVDRVPSFDGGESAAAELSEIDRKIDAMMLTAERVGAEIEMKIVERFGPGFMQRVRDIAASSVGKYMDKGEEMMDAVENFRIPLPESVLEKGGPVVDAIKKLRIPLPKSRLATVLVAGPMIVVGAPAPGGVFLLVPAVVLWKRNAAKWAAERRSAAFQKDVSETGTDDGDYQQLATV